MYAVAAWLVLQVDVVVSEPLGFPEWTSTALIYAAIIGFPVTFILTWMIDIRPEGLIFDLPLLGSDKPVQREQQKSDFVLAGVTLLLVLLASYYLVALLLEQTVSNEKEKLVTTDAISIQDNSIAVLPFRNSGNQESDFFAAGLAEEILNSLARLPELEVASRTSSFQFKNQEVDVRDVASHLQVSHVLEGSARQYKQQIAITTQLAKGSTGKIDWAESYENTVDDIFAVQRSIAESVVSELKVALSIDSQNSLTEQLTESSAAYTHYLEGLGRLRASLDADAMSKASALFQKSIDTDSQFSKAYAGLCEAHLRLYDIRRDSKDFEVAEEACSKANEINAGASSEVYVALGKLYLVRGWHDRSEEQLNRALELDSSHLEAMIQLGELHAERGKPEAARQVLQKAVDLNPDDWSAHEAMASFLYRGANYSDATKAYDKVVQLAPNVATAQAGRGAAYWMLGNYDTALSAYKASVKIKESRQAYTNIGSLYYNQGKFAEAVKYQRKALDLAPEDHRTIGRLAEALYFNGQQQEALTTFEHASIQAKKDLAINPKDWKSHALLGLYSAMLGKGDEAIAAVELAIKESEDNAESWYFLAVIKLQLNDKNSALDALNTAARINNRFLNLAKSDPFLESLRDDERFKTLLNAIDPATSTGK